MSVHVVAPCCLFAWSATGEMLDATQEMITLGLCNIMGSFVRSMPVTGSFSRSAVNNARILIVLALSLLTPYFYFIPRATLSSVIICAVLFMVEVGMVSTMWKSNSENISSINRVTLLRKEEL
uniref:SLC26A/SulP transporter domain-containing protein n=1 Tax=Timema monikensis TaxID=170555 RepID=A0A7R9HMA0_9NEOP|nr:unnamed protein product [Timema monikensis]